MTDEYEYMKWEIRTRGRIETSKRNDLHPGEVVIHPAFDPKEESEAHFLIEGRPFVLKWRHGPLSPKEFRR